MFPALFLLDAVVTLCLISNTNQLVVFGGVRGNKWLNILAVLDTLRRRWGQPITTGDAPRPRSYHSSTVVQSSGLVVIFGGNTSAQCFNTVHVLDTSDPDQFTWSHPKVSGRAPSPRTGHCAVLLDDGKTILI